MHSKRDAIKILCTVATYWLLFSVQGVESMPSWSTAIVSRVDDTTFHYDSSVWTDGIPFNEGSASTNNALFASYTSVYVSKIRITMDGSGDGSCGNRCVFTFKVPDRLAGRHTLRDLVTLDGGVELKQEDPDAPNWINTDKDYFNFGNTYDKYYCHEMALNYANFPYVLERYDQRSRARIGVMMNYYQPCGAWRAAEGLGLQFGWQRQWTDNVGSGRVQYYSSYMFRPAIVEVYGDIIPVGDAPKTHFTMKVDGYTRYPIQVYNFNYTAPAASSPETTFSYMFRLKRETRNYDSQVMRLGTSYFYQRMVMRSWRANYWPYIGYSWGMNQYWDGRKWYTHQRTTYNAWEGVGLYYSLTVGKWHHITFVSNMNYRTIYIDGKAVLCWPFYRGQRKLTSDNAEILALSRGGATPVAEMSDFRYYDREVPLEEIQAMIKEWIHYHKGCGDGERDADEECDDGNYIDGDGCSKECKREAGFVCSGSNSTSIQPDKCEPGVYRTELTFDQYPNGTNASTVFTPSKSWHFDVASGWPGWDMSGTFSGDTLTNMSLGSTSLASATCSDPNYCCESTFGSMIGGLRICGSNCELKSTFHSLPAHNYVRVRVQFAMIDYYYYNWIYMFADDEVRMRVYKHYYTVPTANTEGCKETEGRGSNYCFVNYCGAWYPDDIATFDVYFFHNSSSLSLKFTNTLNSATSKALGFTFLDLEVGMAAGKLVDTTYVITQIDGFVLQTEGAGNIEIGSAYSRSPTGNGLRLWNNAFPSYNAKAGSAFSMLTVPVQQQLRENSFLEFAYNINHLPRYYRGFYLTLIRVDADIATDVYGNTLYKCADSSIDSQDCPDLTFYRICYSSNYEHNNQNSYWRESKTFCNERHDIAPGGWYLENVEIFTKFMQKYGDSFGIQPGQVYLQFGVYGDYYGSERDIEVFLDDIRVGQRASSNINTCPDLEVTASSAGASFSIDGLPTTNLGVTGDWNVQLINATTHLPSGAATAYSTNDLVAYVKSLSYGTMMLLAHSGPITCDADCSAMLESLGGTAFPLSAFGPAYSLAAVGIVGVGKNSMPFSITPYQDGDSSVKSLIGCHEQVIRVGENTHTHNALGFAMKPNNGTSYKMDETAMGYIGCYQMGGGEKGWVRVQSHHQVTPGLCSQACHDNGFAYAILWYYYYCYCADVYGTATSSYTSGSDPRSGTGEVASYYCDTYYCRGDYNQRCGSYSYYSVYQARSAVPYTMPQSGVTCERAQSSGYCNNLFDFNYGSYYRSIDTNPANVTMDLGEERYVDSLRIYAGSYLLRSYDLLCGDASENYYSVSGVLEYVADNYEGTSKYLTVIDADGAYCRYLKLRLLSTSGSYFSIRDMRINIVPTIADKQRMDMYASTSLYNYRNISNGELLVNFAYPSYIAAGMPWGRAYDMFTVESSTGQLRFELNRYDYEFLRSFHIRVRATIQEYDSSWFVMSDTSNFMQIEHGLGTIPWNVRVEIRVQSGANNGFIFQGTGSVMVDGTEIGSVTYDDVAYPETYGGLLFAFDSQYIRLWAPSGETGYIVNVGGGWGHSNLQSEKSADVRVTAAPGTTPQYDSGWVAMQSQSSDTSLLQKDFYHGLGSLKYSMVKVYYRPTSGPNSGFIFEAAGSAQADDDGGSYGGVVFGYTDDFVRIFMPNNTDVAEDNCASGYNKWSMTTGSSTCTSCSTLGGYPCTHKEGYAVFVPPGFGDGMHTQMSHDVEVRVKVWTFAYNKPSFVTVPLVLTSNGVAYREYEHNARLSHSRVYAVCQASQLPYPYYFAGISASAGTDRRPRNYGGVIFAYDNTKVRLWAPAQSLSNMWQAYGQGININDGWGNGTEPVASQEVTVNVVFYSERVGDGLDIRDTSRVSVFIENNNEPPFVKSGDVTITEESNVEGDAIMKLSAFDPDGTVINDYIMVGGNDGDAFRVDSNGTLIVNNPMEIDFEKRQNFSLSIAVSDGYLSEVASVFVTVLDMNDIPVMWPPFGREVREGSPINTLVGDPMNATDTDFAQSVLFYLLDEGNYDDAFFMTTCSGQLRVNNPDALDFEGISGYNFFNLTVLVTDDGDNAGNRTYIVPVTILNRNDPPYWPANMTMTAEIVENSPVGTWIPPNLNTWCRDDDYGDLLSYEIISVANSNGNDMQLDPDADEPVVQNTDFVVNNVTGNLTSGSNNFNFESVFSYRVMIRCTDYNLYEEQEPPNLYADGFVNVIVIDANDAPVFEQESLVQGIYENSAMGAITLNSPVYADDEDVNDYVTYFLLDDYGGMFDIDPDNGNIFQRTSTSLDYEVVQKLQLTVMASDHGILTDNRTVDAISVIAVVNITVGDVNEAPSFLSSSFSVEEVVKRGSPQIGDTVFIVNGTDPDIFANQDLTFTITGASPAEAVTLFRVDNDAQLSARLVIDDVISFESASNFTLYFSVQDNGGVPGGSGVGLIGTGTVDVTIFDLNDDPVFDCTDNPSACVFSVDENSLTGTTVGTCSATDEDGDTLTWSFVSPPISISNRFAIDSATGAITVQLATSSIINYEAVDEYSVTVRVADSSGKINGAGFEDAIFKIRVNDVAESPYRTSATPLEFGVAKSGNPGDLVGSSLSNFFADEDAASTLSYSISATMMVYPDDGGSYSDSVIFDIDAVTGQLSLTEKPSTALGNTVEDDELVFNITVFDGIFSHNETITVVVRDDNLPPSINIVTCSMTENVVGPVDICLITAVDPEGDSVTFSLSNPISDYFRMNPDGRLALLSGASFNYEATNSYVVEVVATDSAKYSQSSRASITVNIIDDNDAPLVSNYAFTIPENQVLGSLPFLLDFSDEDNDALLCSASGTAVFNAGEVNSVNSNITLDAVLGAADSSDAAFTVSESNSLVFVYFTLHFDPLISSASLASDISLSITDGSGRQWTYTNWPASWDSGVKGTYFAGLEVDMTLAGSGTWTVSIVNTGSSSDNVHYIALVDMSFNGRDTSDNSMYTTCYLGLLSEVDFETKSIHKFGVSVSDGQISRISNITMTITDVNEPPVMNDYVLIIDENSEAGTAAVWGSDPSMSNLIASDQEDDVLVFTIVSGNDAGVFGLQSVQSSGPATFRVVVAAGADIDYENVNQYVLVVEANETLTSERLSTRATVTVIVNNVNDVTITSVRNTATDAFGNDNAPLRTDGGDIMVISGTNFGSMHTPESVRVTYGPLGTEYTATGCAVTPGNNTEITCMSVAGIGMEHVWKVEILSSSHSYMTTYASRITTYYYRPHLTNVTNVNVPGGTYRTVGNEKMTLDGSQFGSSTTAGQWQFVGISKIGALGSNFRLEDTMEEGNHKCRAGTVFYGAALKSQFLLVSDSCPSAGQVTVTVQQKFAADGVSQFNPTNVAAYPCDFDRTLDADWMQLNDGGRIMDINSVYDYVVVPSAALLVTTSPTESALVKACPSTTVWRTYYNPKPIVYYANFDSSTFTTPNSTGVELLGGYSLLAENCTLKANSIGCETARGVGFNYRARLLIAGMLSDEIVDASSFISYHAPVILSLNSSVPLLDTRGYTSATPQMVTIKTLFSGSNADFQGYGAGVVTYGKDVMNSEYGLYTASCTVSTTGETYSYCRSASPTSCFDEQVDVLSCKPVAGIGMEHAWQAVVGDQLSNTSPQKTSYKAPIITSMNPGQWPFDNTAGGASITIMGDQMGPVLLDASYGTMTAKYGSIGQFESGLLFETVVGSCSITVAHEVMVCLTGEGTGKNHSWQLTIAEQPSNTFAAGSSYVPPILVDFATYNQSLGNGIPEDVLSFATSGYQLVEIVGRNFGPVYDPSRYNAPIIATTRYVDSVGESHLWTYFNCTIIDPHERMICVTSVGVGAELKWNLLIDNQTNTVPTTAYAPPVLTTITGVGFDISQGIATRGGQYVDLEGENFGPDMTYVERISFGPSGGEYLLHDAEAKVLNCEMTVAHKVFRCRIPAGYGQRHYFTIKVAGQKTSTLDIADDERISYKTPIITSVTPANGTSKGGYSVTITGSNFGPSSGAVLRFWDTLYAAFPLTYFNHEKMTFEIPEGQGADRVMRVGHASASCLDDCQQFSAAFNFTYIAPNVDRLIFADSYLEGYSNLTLYGKTSDSKPNLNGGSFGSGLSYTWLADDGTEHEFANRVWIFGYNTSETLVDDTLNEMYSYYDTLNQGDFSELSIPGMPKPCAVTEAYDNVWNHNMINCLTIGTNGTLAVVVYDVRKGVYQRSSLFHFKEKSPVVYTPIQTTPVSQADPYPTQGGFMLTIRGLYFGALTVVGATPAGVDILFYLDGYMDYVKCHNVTVSEATNSEQETTLTCVAPPGQGKNVVVIVRKGGEGSNSVSDYIYGENCDACISYDPPVVSGYSTTVDTRRRLLAQTQTTFPVACSTVGLPKLVIYGKNFGLVGGVHMMASTTTLVEDVSQHSATSITVAIPQGVGEEILFKLQVANQLVEQATNFYMDYYPPTIESASKMLLHTSGGEELFIVGSDFGMSAIEEPELEMQQYDEVPLTYSVMTHASSTSVSLVGIDDAYYVGFVDLDGIRLDISSWNHTHIQSTTVPARGGTGISLIVSADGQTDNLVGFAYYPPTITSISTTHAPTSGETHDGEPILMTLFGDDFGSPDADKYVTFGPYHINSTKLNTTHTTCSFYIPEGQGVNLPISITVEGQESNSKYFSYEPPLASSLTPTIGNTDACTQWESLQAYVERLDKDPFAKRMCLTKVYLTLEGYSFGTSGMKIVVADADVVAESLSSNSRRLSENSIVCETDSAGQVISDGWNCMDCAAGTCGQDHNAIVVWAPQSYGVNLTVMLYVDGRRDTNSTPLFYSYYPPEVTVSSPGSAAQGYGYFDAMGDALTIQGKNLGGTPSPVEVNFTSRNFITGKTVDKRCQDAKWNAGRPTVGDGFPYLTCNMPMDIVGAKNMTIRVAEQTIEVPVRRNPDNSLFISACKAKYDSDNQQTIYYGLRYYEELCVECPVGARCKPEEYLVDPVGDEEFWLLYFDINSKDAEDQCSKYRMPPMTKRDKCPVFSGCFPSEACTGSNTCDKAYSYVVEECRNERRKNADKYNNNTCSSDYDCNKGEDICKWNEPEKCSYCDKVPGTAEGKCVCVAAPRCSLCKIKEYYRIGGKCVKCPQNVIVLIVLFCTALLAFVVAGYYLNKYKFNLAFVAIGFDYFQVLAIFASSDIVWPPLVIKMFTISMFFSFDINLTAPECAFPDISYEMKWYISMVLPLMGGIVLFLMFWSKLIHKYIWRHKRGWTALTKHGNQLMAMFMIMLYYLYLPLLRKALEIVNCNPADPDDGHLYTEWTSVSCPGGYCKCWEDPDDPQMQLLPWAMLSLVVYAIGYPVYVSYVLFKYKPLIQEDQLLRAMNLGDTRATNPIAYDVRKKYHKLYYHFKPGKTYWMLIVLCRKFWIAVAALLFRSNPTFQLSFILLVLFICYVLQVQHRPFMSTMERESELNRHRMKVEEAMNSKDDKVREQAVARHLQIQRSLDNVRRKEEVIKKRAVARKDNNKDTGDFRVMEVTSEEVKEFFWDFNNVELYLLGCAVFVCIAGIMFESDTYGDNSTMGYHLLLLTFMVVIVVTSSLLYFGVVFTSELLTTFGYDASNKIFLMFMSKEYKKKREKSSEGDELELSAVSMGENPMVKRSESSQEEETKRAIEVASLAEENEQLMKQISDLKKKEQSTRMRSFRGAGGSGISTQKKLKKKSTFDSEDSGTGSRDNISFDSPHDEL